MKPEKYFKLQQSVSKKQYDALRTHFVDKRPASEVAQRYGQMARRKGNSRTNRFLPSQQGIIFDGDQSGF